MVTFPAYTDGGHLLDNKDDELCKLSLIGVNFDTNFSAFSRSLASALSLFFILPIAGEKKGKIINRKAKEEIFSGFTHVFEEREFCDPNNNIKLVYYYTMCTAHVFLHFCYNIAYDYLNTNSGLVRVINYLFPLLPKTLLTDC